MTESPRGFQRIAGSASLPQAITITNSNLQNLFTYMEQAFRGLDSLSGQPVGTTFKLTSKANPTVKNNLINNPNENLPKKEPDDEIQFVEKSRKCEIVKIYNPDDKTQWVKVLRITELVMRDKVTGKEWVWKLGNIENHIKNATEAPDEENVP